MADNIAATSAELYCPSGVAVDSAGNLYIADERNQRIRKVNTSGTITTVAGNGTAGYNGDNIAATSAEVNPAAVEVAGARAGTPVTGAFANPPFAWINTSGTT